MFFIGIATKDDVEALVKLVNSAYRGDGALVGWTTEAHLLDGIRTDALSVQEMIDEPNSIILKVLDENNLVGCVYLQKKQYQLYLGMLSVDPRQQKKGIGKQLIKASEAFARQENICEIVMTVISVRTELIDWYERNGYHKTGETEPFPQNIKFGIPKQPLEFVVMKKELSNS